MQKKCLELYLNAEFLNVFHNHVVFYFNSPPVAMLLDLLDFNLKFHVEYIPGGWC